MNDDDKNQAKNKNDTNIPAIHNTNAVPMAHRSQHGSLETK